MNLEGVLLPVPTPFDHETGDPAPVSFRENLRTWLDRGVHGFVLAGSTGEAPLLDESEFADLVEWARDIVPVDRTLIAGAGAESTRQTIRLARAASERGADALLVRPPAYYRRLMDTETLRIHYERVADSVDIPVVLYNVPQFVPVEVGPALVAELGTHPNVAGIKDSTGDLKWLGELLDAAPPGCRVMVGSGSRLYAGLEMGAAGGIVAIGCIATRQAVELYRQYEAGAMAAAGAAQTRMAAVDELVVRELGVPGIKFALDLLGLAGGQPRPPLRPLGDRARPRVLEALRDAGLIEPEVG